MSLSSYSQLFSQPKYDKRTSNIYKQKQQPPQWPHKEDEGLHSMTQYAKSLLTAPILSLLAVAMVIEFSDESCPPMRCIRHSDRSGRPFQLTAVHLPTNLTAVCFSFRPPPPPPILNTPHQHPPTPSPLYKRS